MLLWTSGFIISLRVFICRFCDNHALICIKTQEWNKISRKEVYIHDGRDAYNKHIYFKAHFLTENGTIYTVKTYK